MAKKQEKQGIGDRIRAMRNQSKFDLNQLAERTGLAVEYLQEIEDGKAAPSVSSLIQISRALSVDTGTLLAEEKKQERRQSHLKRTKAYAYKSLTPDAEDKHLWAYLVTLDPKKEHEMVAYKHEGEEFVFVLEGRVEIRVADEVHEVKKGASLHFNSGTQHNLRNLSTKHSKLLVVVYTP
jgi:transcriptional regulator with XRE-family HTH domain